MPEKSIRCQLPGNLSGTAVRVTGKSLHEHDDAAAAQFDPEKDDDAAEEAAAVAAFAQNPDDISMEFPGENQVCLHVSDAYQAYAAEMGYTAYLDFFWMKKCFFD